MKTNQIILSPIEHPKGLWMKFVYWFSQRQFGAVISPIKILYSRIPALLNVSRIFQKITENLEIPKSTTMLIKYYIAAKNGCAFCKDIALAESVRSKLGIERFTWLLKDNMPQNLPSELFSDKEKEALRFCLLSLHHEITEADRNRLANFYSERQIIEIAWLVAMETYYNLLSGATGVPADSLLDKALSKTPEKLAA